MKKTLTLAALLLFPALSQGATLLHHWDFNGGDLSDKVTNDADWAMTEKGNTDKITYPSSSITTGTGDYGDSFTTSGTGNGAYLGASGSLGLGGDFSMTVMAWVNPTEGHDLALFGVGRNGEGLKIGLREGKVQLTTKNVADFGGMGDSALALNTWSHIALSITRENNAWTIDYFVNGESIRKNLTYSHGMNVGDVSGFTIGSGSTAGQDAKNSAFDDVKIYDGKLSADDVKLAMQGSSAAVPEPTTASLGLLGLTALLLRRRRLA